MIVGTRLEGELIAYYPFSLLVLLILLRVERRETSDGSGYLPETRVSGTLENVTYFHDISNHLLASGFQCGILL